VTLRRLGLFVGVLAVSQVHALRAQDVLQIGAQVRISGLDLPGSPVVGMYAGAVGDTVLIGLPGGSDALRVPRRAITHLEVQLGMRSGAARTSVLGMLAGTAAAGAVALAVRARIRPIEGLGVVLAGGAVGTMAGGLAGQTMFRAPRWVEAPLEMLREEGRRP